jgi:DNA topoisomerase-1
LKTFDADPVSGKPILLKDGRFGPYVTDGEINATVPRGMSLDDLDFEAAVQLIADKRAKGPAPKRTAKKKAPAKKKPAAKKTTTKTVAKKKAPASKSGNPSSKTPKTVEIRTRTNDDWAVHHLRGGRRVGENDPDQPSGDVA